MWGHLAPKLGPRQAQCGIGSHKPPSKQKNDGNSSKNASFQHVALGPQNWLGLGPTWPLAALKTWAQVALGANSEVGPQAIQMDSKLKPCGFTPSWAQGRHDMGNIASNEASSIAKKRGTDWAGHVPHFEAIWAYYTLLHLASEFHSTHG